MDNVEKQQHVQLILYHVVQMYNIPAHGHPFCFFGFLVILDFFNFFEFFVLIQDQIFQYMMHLPLHEKLLCMSNTYFQHIILNKSY